jgi:hypothetical protein
LEKLEAFVVWTYGFIRFREANVTEERDVMKSSMKRGQRGAMITKKVAENQRELTVDTKIEAKEDAGGQEL